MSLRRTSGVGLVISALILASVQLAASHSAPPTGSTSGEPYPDAVRFAENLMIPMRDGIRLATDIYRPAVNGRAVDERMPVLFVRTPYDKRDRGARPEVAYFARQGYVVAVQDTRGRYASEGVFRKYFDHDATDGYDSIEYLARLPYALPMVGMWGTSYSAHAIADAAKLNPPSLRAALINEGGMSSAWEQTVRFNGAFEVGRQLSWAWRQLQEETRDTVIRAMLAAEPVEKWYARLPLRRGLSPLAADTVVEDYYLDMATRADYDDYWRTLGQEWKPYYAQTADIPMLHVGGWYDIYTQTTVDNFLGLSAVKRSPVSLMLGPWTHGADMPSRTWAGEVDFGPAAGIQDFAGRFHVEFFDFHLKGKRTPAATAPRVRVFVMGGGDGRKDANGRLRHGGRWREADSWPLPGTRMTPFYFHADGSLGTTAPTARASSTTYTFDPRNPVPTIGGGVSARLTDGAFHQRERPDFHGSRPPYLPLASRPDVVVFQTPPLERDVELVGPIGVVLYVSSSAVDTDFTVKLVDVHPRSADYPNGFDLNLTDGIQRARFRNGRHTASLLTPGEVYEIRFDLYPTANLFKRGHRIRVDVSSSNFPRFDVNPNTGEPLAMERRAIPADNTIHHQVGRASHVLLPVQPAP